MNKSKAQRSHHILSLKSHRAEVEILKKKVLAVVDAQKLIQEAAKQVQQQAHTRVAKLVTKCLDAVFEGDAYEFEIAFEKRRGKTEATLSFVRDDNHRVAPMSAAGGGAVDVGALALRLASLALSYPKRRLFVALDEHFKFLHGPTYRRRLSGLLRSLAKELKIQFILVTQDPAFQIGECVEL